MVIIIDVIMGMTGACVQLQTVMQAWANESARNPVTFCCNVLLLKLNVNAAGMQHLCCISPQSEQAYTH